VAASGSKGGDLMRTIQDLIQMQSAPLEVKILMTQRRIREWVTEFGTDGVYVSFSGGKDSTVLLHLVRELYPDVEAVFVNTGLEYPEIQRFVKTFDNVKVLYPEMSFKEVISTYGYPLLSKSIAHKIESSRRGLKWAEKYLEGTATTRNGLPSVYNAKKYKPLVDVDFNISPKCCDVMKKSPVHKYEKESGKVPIIATMASESKTRLSGWLRTGCNAFEAKNVMSKPMSFWTEQDVLEYIRRNDIKIASVYGEIYRDIPEQIPGQPMFEWAEECISGCKLCTTGCGRTGCIFCGFGAHLEKGEGRFERLKRTHPKQYDFLMNGGSYDSDGIWKPDKNGLGMKHVIDTLNSLYGEDFIKY
jgi:3'-phosphoadenosine 5'-phosphosulfate sulfotransferase (PAPS reductase)/FAD synthetase